MRPSISLTALAIVAALATLPVLGAEADIGSGSVTGSGSSASFADPLIAERSSRRAAFDAEASKKEIAETQYRQRLDLYQRRRTTHREECRLQLRLANRDARFKTLLRCYREELSFEKEFRTRQREYVKGALGAGKTTRDAAAQRLDALVDALGTVITAIDGEVYVTEADLLEARSNLQTRYRAPAIMAFSLLRIDRALSWIAQILFHLGEGDTSGTGSGQTQLAEDSFQTCLTARESAFREMLRSGTGTTASVQAQLTSLSVCLQKGEAALVPASGSESSSTGSAQSQP